MLELIAGKAALETLATRFPQLYVAPAEGAQGKHKLASTLGVAPEGANLDHFRQSELNELRCVSTPAGPIEVLFLQERGDFETFLQIVGHKSQPAPIARTIGAITYRGLADWGKVAQARASYLGSGGENWPAEFARLAQEESGAFRSELIVVSSGPYSNLDASRTPYDQDTWLQVSRDIRLYHECAHVVCRRTTPEDIAPIWDELIADAIGLLFATGSYNTTLAAHFLGVAPEGFEGGRLTEYLDSRQQEQIDAIAREVHAAITGIGERAGSEASDGPFEFLLELKHSPIIDY